jgi:hypothetical protein
MLCGRAAVPTFSAVSGSAGGFKCGRFSGSPCPGFPDLDFNQEKKAMVKKRV